MDRKSLYEPQSGALTVQYEPDETTVLVENPPRFTWIAAKPENDRYTLQISSSPDFAGAQTLSFAPIHHNLFTPDRPLTPGDYYWRYALLDDHGHAKDTEARSVWSRTRRFTITEGLPETPLAGRAERFAQAGPAHPRLWLQPDRLNAFRQAVQTDAGYCGWSDFYDQSVRPWLERTPIAEPKPYPNNKKVAALWRQMYIDCQELLYAIRHLAIAGVVLEDDSLKRQAKLWLLHAATWDPEGPTSRDYNDEAAFRVAGALAWGYDWLHGELSVDERALVRRSLLRRTEQVAFHVIDRSRIHQVPYDSHAVRSLSSVLVPCCIALLGEEPKAKEWLDYTVEYLFTLYSPWGGPDGGWAEGPMYWTTGMAFVIEAINLLRSYTGIDLYRRPFFRNTGDFPLYCFSPDTLRASFGDQSTLGQPVSLKTGFNIRQFAGITGNGAFQWYYEQTRIGNAGNEMKFYNWGWWDFRFDDMAYRCDFPEVAATPPSDLEPLRWFRDIGWVAMHHRADDPEEHIVLLTKSSKYGSVSHSHGDQNTFLLHAYGEPLAIHSGHYVAFGSTMHMNWRRQTRSKNGILIDGQGQYAGTNKVLNMAATGEIVRAERRSNSSYVRADATAAYQENVPYLTRYEREIYFFQNSYFVIVDHVDLTQPGCVEWLLHTLHESTLRDQTFTVNGRKADMDVQFIYSSSGKLSFRQSNAFTDVDPDEIEGLERHWHVAATTPLAANHRIVTLLVPKRKEDGKYVSHFMDDQGHGVNIYFTDNGITDKVEVAVTY